MHHYTGNWTEGSKNIHQKQPANHAQVTEQKEVNIHGKQPANHAQVTEQKEVKIYAINSQKTTHMLLHNWYQKGDKQPVKPALETEQLADHKLCKQLAHCAPVIQIKRLTAHI